MTAIEKKQWDELYQYVKKEILMYDDTQSIPSNLVLRLKGLTTGKFIENKSIKNKANYTYEIILYTFQICKPIILSSLQGHSFNNESHKFNFICKIVEENINDVYIRLNSAKENSEKTKNIDTKVFEHKGGKYTKKTTEITNPKLNDLW